MTFAEFWLALQKKNPGLQSPDNKMTISVSSFEKSMKSAFEAGRECGANEKSAFESIFGKMF